MERRRVFQEVKMLLGDKPLVLDREFSYEDMLESLVSKKLKFAIHPKT